MTVSVAQPSAVPGSGPCVPGLWLLSSSWQPWRGLFEANGFATIAPGWPDDPRTVAEAYDAPEAFAHKMVQQVTDHYLEAISRLADNRTGGPWPPAGHSKRVEEMAVFLRMDPNVDPTAAPARSRLASRARK